MFKKIELWIVLLLSIIGIASAILFGAVVRDYYVQPDHYRKGFIVGTVAPVANLIASAPRTLQKWFRDVDKKSDSDLRTPNQKYAASVKSNFSFSYGPGANIDLGAILISRYDGDQGHAVVELFDLNRQILIHTWTLAGIDEVLSTENVDADTRVQYAASRFLATNPILTTDGSLVFHGGGGRSPLFKADSCSRLQIIDPNAGAHHSLEAYEEGFWFPSRFRPASVETFGESVADDAIAFFSSSRNQITLKRSVIDIIEKSGLDFLLYGMGEHNITNPDPIHLNDIQPVLQDGAYWKRGDVFLSSRHLSTIFLYRPSLDKIIWHKTGPWKAQHDVNIVADGVISVFDNNLRMAGVGKTGVFGTSSVLIYDFETDEIVNPFEEAFKSLNIIVPFQGRGTVENGYVFVEETPAGRLSQFDENGNILWEYVNRSKEGEVFYLAWSRLYPSLFIDGLMVESWNVCD